MEKIIVNPRQVRALGDIVSPKCVADFEKYCCTLTESTDASFGDLYTSEFLPGARLVIDYPGSVSVDDDDFTVDVLLKDDSGAVISGASVYCDFNGDLSSETTDSNGEASFTLSCDGESSEYWFRVCYAGTGSLAGAICRGVVTVVDYEGVDFSLLVDNPVLCGGEFAEFVAKLDVLNGSGVMVPVSGAVVEFYMDVDVEPASISLISDKDILSYADGGDSCTLTATVLGSDSQPYEGATVVFKAYKGETLVETIGSDTTDSSGVASVSYSSKGAGDLSIRAECMNVSGTFSIEDIYYYGDYDKIKSNWTKNTAVSGRDIYSPTFSDLTDDVEVELKFKNTVPDNFVMGFGAISSPYTMKATFLKIVNYNSFSAYYATSSQDNQHTDISTTLTTNTVMKLVTENLHTVKWYVDDVLKVTQNTRTSLPLHLRLDDFTSTPLNLDYIKIRKL